MSEILAMTPKLSRVTGSRRHKVRFDTTTTSMTVNSYWDGSSAHNYRVMNLKTGASFVPQGNAPLGAQGRPAYKLQPGDMVIVTGTFRCQPAIPAIHCRAEDADTVRAWLNLP